MYTRYANPTITAAEKKIAALEGAESCVVTASGMAAETIVLLTLLHAGDEVVSMLDVYGGTIKLFEQVLARFAVKTTFVPFPDLHRIERYFTRKTRMLFLETPTNPTLRCVDIAGLAHKAHKRGITVVVDNTFATPILQQPLDLGAEAGHLAVEQRLGLGAPRRRRQHRLGVDPETDPGVYVQTDPGAGYPAIPGSGKRTPTSNS